jgi:hypothetical protein
MMPQTDDEVRRGQVTERQWRVADGCGEALLPPDRQNVAAIRGVNRKPAHWLQTYR